MAARFGIPAVYDDLDTMLADADLDIVVNLTPIPAHFETSLQIIEHGVHLVTEKPLAQTLAEADKLCAAAARARRGRRRRRRSTCSPTSGSDARRLVRSGAIGRVSFGRLQSSHGGPGADVVAG